MSLQEEGSGGGKPSTVRPGGTIWDRKNFLESYSIQGPPSPLLIRATLQISAIHSNDWRSEKMLTS